MELLKRIQELELDKTGQFSKPFSVIQVSQFYGIEIDDFAHEIAILSLWLAEHQMNIMFKDEFGELIPLLPLKSSGTIICANALAYDWNKVLKNNGEEIYILGNPPYYGARKQTEKQKAELKQLLAILIYYMPVLIIFLDGFIRHADILEILRDSPLFLLVQFAKGTDK
jgi:hypothetical protein